MAKQGRSLAGKVVFITGAARGIGRATATALVAEGARVAIGDLDEDLAKRTAKELGPDVLALRLDVTDHGGYTAVLDEVERELGPIDVLINNAGIMPVITFEDESEASIRRQFEVNVFAVMHGTREAIKRMNPAAPGTSSTSLRWPESSRHQGHRPTAPASMRWSVSASRSGGSYAAAASSSATSCPRW